MHLLFDIFQGIGVAAAVGIRPFLPALAVGGLAEADAEIHFNGTNFSFLEQVPFLLAMAICAILLLVAERRMSSKQLERGVAATVLALVSLALGAVLFGGSLARGHYLVWPAIVGGVVCAAVGIVATRPLFARVRSRLDAGAASLVPLYAEVAAVLSAALSVVAPPVGAILLLCLLWLLIAGRRREGQKYAGLRILR